MMDAWTPQDMALQIPCEVLIVTDWFQTLEFTTRKPPRREIENPFLGQYPSRARINSVVPLALAFQLAISIILPHPWRTIWQLGTIGVEIGSVSHNIRAGFGLKFP